MNPEDQVETNYKYPCQGCGRPIRIPRRTLVLRLWPERKLHICGKCNETPAVHFEPRIENSQLREYIDSLETILMGQSEKNQLLQEENLTLHKTVETTKQNLATMIQGGIRYLLEMAQQEGINLDLNDLPIGPPGDPEENVPGPLTRRKRVREVYSDSEDDEFQKIPKMQFDPKYRIPTVWDTPSSPEAEDHQVEIGESPSERSVPHDDASDEESQSSGSRSPTSSTTSSRIPESPEVATSPKGSPGSPQSKSPAPPVHPGAANISSPSCPGLNDSEGEGKVEEEPPKSGEMDGEPAADLDLGNFENSEAEDEERKKCRRNKRKKKKKKRKRKHGDDDE